MSNIGLHRNSSYDLCCTQPSENIMKKYRHIYAIFFRNGWVKIVIWPSHNILLF